MGLLQTVLVDGGPRRLPALARRALRPAPAAAVRHAARYARWSEQTIIALVMQSLDNSLTVRYGAAGSVGAG